MSSIPDQAPDATTLIYVADPMCSWCWGFAPVIGALVERCGPGTDLHVVAGGLRPGTRDVTDSSMKDYLRGHWQHVGEMTGQPFNHAFFERDDFVYDTEPACRALVTARRLRKESALPMLERLHAAFYRDNRDITDKDTLCDLAAEAGHDRERFREEFETDAMREATREDFMLSRRLGVRGFPSLFISAGDHIYRLAEGYCPLETIVARLADVTGRPRTAAR